MKTISQELNQIYTKQMQVLDKVVSSLFSELQKRTPVDKGSLKGAWDKQETDSGWTISNNMTYASVIFDGRKFVYSPSFPNGRWEGSEKLPEGIDPIIARFNIILQNELKKVRV